MSIVLKPFSVDYVEPKKKVALLVWVALTAFCVIQSLITYRYNNYLIFENTFRNLIKQQSLYSAYPQYHFDTNHYGPIFSVFIVFFAALPNALGFLLWNLFNTIVLFIAIDTIKIKNKLAIYYVAIPCLISSALSQQFNPAAAAFIVLTFTQLNVKKGFWSSMLIVLGAFIKLYGIVGLAFFFFVKDKKRFVGYLLFWAVLFLALPMLFSSPQFIISSYQEWLHSLIIKNQSNIIGATNDISIMGFVRTLMGNYSLPNVLFLLGGCILFGLPFINFKAYNRKKFQLYILASTLMFPVLFSTGSEDCTYIIAIIGVGIWYVLSKRKLWEKILLAITIVFSCNFPLLLFPKVGHQYPILFPMLSVPFFIVWLSTIYRAASLKLNNVDDVKEEE